jgi:SAM-dependent methyltransferase
VLRRIGARLPAPLVRTFWVIRDRAGLPYRVTGELQRCPACGADSIEHLLPLPLHDRPASSRVGFASGCRRCGIVFANPMPSADALAHMYSPDGRWGSTHRDDHREAQPSSRYLARLLGSMQPAIDITQPPPGATVLDFGCGSGEILDALQDLGWTTFGVEPAVKTAFTRHQELAAIPESPMCDLAIAHHVLEHVSNPLDILRSLSACLRPGGLLLVSVPRLDGLADHGDFRYCINDRAHIVSYTRDAMAALMGMAGFEAIALADSGGSGRSWRAAKRLVMAGRTSGMPTRVEEPLRAARAAIAAWQTRDARARGGGLPVRAAAAIMNVERSR